MRNFTLLEKNIDINPLLKELEARQALWQADESRQKIAPAQRETRSIYLRHFDGRVTAAGRQLPVISAWAERYCYLHKGKLARVALANLQPGGQVYKHIDGDGNSGNYRYYDYRDRIHLVLQSDAGTRFTCGGEEVYMRPGELWWFDNKKPHEAFNESTRDRIHLIIDIRNRRSVLRGLRRKLRGWFGKLAGRATGQEGRA